MKNYESLSETLSFYGVNCNKLYYVSSGNPIFEFPNNAFRIDFYAFCICLFGSIDIEIDSKKYTISQGEFLISAPTTVLKIIDRSHNFRMKLLFFEKNFLLKNNSSPFFIEQLDLFIHQSFTVCKAEPKESKHLFILLNYLQEQSTRNVLFLEDILRTIIVALLLETASIINQYRIQSQENLLTDNNLLFYKFTELVKKHYIQHQSVQFYADQLCITNKYLIQLVKKATSKTPHLILNEYLIKEALVLLGNPSKPIVQIADHLGFNSSSSFGRFFKKHTSYTPQEYRKQHKI